MENGVDELQIRSLHVAALPGQTISNALVLSFSDFHRHCAHHPAGNSNSVNMPQTVFLTFAEDWVGWQMLSRKGYPTDVSEEEWAFAAPYLCLMREDAPQREHSLREVFNGLRYLARAGCGWRLLPNDLPPWKVVYDQSQRWIKAGVFEAMAHDLRAILRLAMERPEDPSAVILDARTLQSSVESGARAGYDGHKKKKGSKVHLAVDTLGHLLALHVTPANEQERAQVGELAVQVVHGTRTQ